MRSAVYGFIKQQKNEYFKLLSTLNQSQILRLLLHYFSLNSTIQVSTNAHIVITRQQRKIIPPNLLDLLGITSCTFRKKYLTDLFSIQSCATKFRICPIIGTAEIIIQLSNS